MSEQAGDDTLFIGEDLALSSGSKIVGEYVVLYGPNIARGGSAPAVDQDALLLQEGLAQTGPGLNPLQFQVNGGPVKSFEPIKTAQTVEDFYGFSQGAAQHGYEESEVTTLLLHENTNTGTLAFVITHHDGDNNGSQSDYAIRTNWSEPLNSDTDIRAKDGPGSGEDEYHDTWMGHDFPNKNTDGVAFESDPFSGKTVDFTLDHTYSGNRSGAVNGIQDFRFIYQDGPTPDGGAVDYAGRNGTITVNIP